MEKGIDAILTAVIPVTRMASRLENLENTLLQCRDNRVKVVLVHDVQDGQTGPELQNLVHKITISHSPFITLIERYCGSAGLARNLGRNFVNTEWIAFWDSDDIASVREFLQMVIEAKEHNDQLAIGGYRVLDSSSKLPISIGGYIEKKANREAEIFLNPGLWRWAFQNELINSINFQDFKMGEDQVFLLDSAVFDHRIFYSHDVVYEYLINSNFQSTNNKISFAGFCTATSYIFKTFGSKTPEMKKFASVVLLRLFFTGIRKCNFTEKINLIIQFSSHFLVIFLKNPIRIGFALRLVIIGSIKRVIK